jgi:hypothetical protein
VSDKPAEPFMLLTETPPKLPPRPTQTVAEMLGRALELIGQTLKRQQQTAMLVDGFASAVSRRFDVLHEEMALLRVVVGRPHDGGAAADDIDVTVERTRAQKVRGAIALTGQLASYATTVAIGLRLIGKNFPEYEAVIDGLLGLFGL